MTKIRGCDPITTTCVSEDGTEQLESLPEQPGGTAAVDQFSPPDPWQFKPVSNNPVQTLASGVEYRFNPGDNVHIPILSPDDPHIGLADYRQREFTALSTAFSGAVSEGHGAVIAVVGYPGSGRRHLVQRFINYLHQQGLRTHVHSMHEWGFVRFD
ncbi:MAG: hypothetical protein Q7S00_07290, partial [bacterium]|nr:hypothetical protein [bacterium]